MRLAAGLRPSASTPLAAVLPNDKNPSTNEPRTTAAATIYLKIGVGESFVGSRASLKMSLREPGNVGLEL